MAMDKVLTDLRVNYWQKYSWNFKLLKKIVDYSTQKSKYEGLRVLGHV